MTQRDHFGPEYIRKELHTVGETLAQEVTAFLIGGGAMSLRNLKTTTKDIDLVVTTDEEYERLLAALTERGYEEVTDLGENYRELGARLCVRNDDGCQIDLFNRQVANKLVFSDGMDTRSESFLTHGPLSVHLTALEDIFLFKAVAKRPDDIDDMATLVQTSLEFDTIEAELDTQAELLGSDLFVTYVSESLAKLEERHGIQTPIDDVIIERHAQYMSGFEIRLELDEDGPTPIPELADALGLDTDTVEERVARLEERGFVRLTPDGVVDTGKRERFDN